MTTAGDAFGITDLIPIDRFIADHSIVAEVIRVDEKPGFVEYTEPFSRRPSGMIPTPSVEKDGDRDWQHYAWSVTLHRNIKDAPRPLSTPYKTGIAHVTKTGRGHYYPQWGETLPTYKPTPPSVADVLDSLASDASTYDNSRNFEDFCAELGYDPDSRRAEKLYNTLAEGAKALRMFLGNEAYSALLYEVERL